MRSLALCWRANKPVLARGSVGFVSKIMTESLPLALVWLEKSADTTISQ